MSCSSERQEIITLQQNRRAATHHKGCFGFLYICNKSKCLFLGWHSCASWYGVGRSLWPPTYTLQIRFLGHLLFPSNVVSAITTTFLILIFLCSGQPWHHEASVTREEWPGSGECLDICENLFYLVFGRKELRRGLGQEEALIESKGKGLISSR